MDLNNNNGLGSNAELFSVNLGKGYTYCERADFSGHKSGKVDPHINGEIFNPQFLPLPRPFKDLTNNQFPGMNQMQTPGVPNLNPTLGPL